MERKIGFVCFGEVNTPIKRLRMKHDEGLEVIRSLGYAVTDAGLVIDDPAYETADAAVAKLAGLDMSVFVYDYDHNAPSLEHLEQTHEPLFKTIRAKHPDLPVVMVSVSDDAIGDTIMARRDVILRTYNNAKAAGDENVYFVDGRRMYDQFGLALCTELLPQI